MTLGLSTYSFPCTSNAAAGAPGRWLHELVDLTASYRCGCLQIGDNVCLDQLDAADLDTMARNAAERNIELQLGVRRFTETHMLHAIDTARKIGSPFLRIIIDDNDYKPSYGYVRDLILRLLPAFRNANVILAIENHDRFPAATLRTLIEETDPAWVGICLDTANSLGIGEGIGEILPVLAPYVVNLHIKDISITRVLSGMGFRVTGAIAGAGILDLPDIISRIAVAGRCRSAVLEHWNELDPGAESTRAEELLAVQQSISYLKKFFP